MSRWPIATHPWPVHSDERQFVAAIGFPDPYPVHHPGYPGWVALGTIAHRLGLNDYDGYQAVSMIAAAAAAVILFLMLRHTIPESTAWWAGAAMGANPLGWFCSVTALNYSCAAAIGLLILGLCWRAQTEARPGLFVWAVAAFVPAVGIRQDVLMWFSPLLLWSAWKIGRRAMVLTVLAIAATALAWGFVSNYIYHGAGGPRLSHTIEVIKSTSIFHRGLVDGLLRNGVKWTVYLGWAFGLAIPIIGDSLVNSGGIGRSKAGPLRIVAVSLLPIVLFQWLIHVTEVGHVLWYIGPTFLWLAVTLYRRIGAHMANLSLAAITVISAAQFWLYPWSVDQPGWRRTLNAKVAFVSASGLRQITQRRRIHTPNDFWRVDAP